MASFKSQKASYCRNKCKAWCCRNLVFHYGGTDDEVDLLKFFNLRNFIYNVDTRTVIVPARCKYITSHNRCKLYCGRPDICRHYECDDLKNFEPLHYAYETKKNDSSAAQIFW